MAVDVRFIKCNYSAYAALTSKDEGALYFCTDTKQLFVGSVEYANQMQGSGIALPETAKLGDMYILNDVPYLYVGSWISLQSSISLAVTGTGNVITGATFENNKLTLTKGMNAEASGTAASKVAAHNTDGSAHADIRSDVSDAKQAASDAQESADNAQNALDDHIADDANPHGVTAAQVGAYTKAETDSQIQAKLVEGGAHTHDNKEELDKIASGDKAKWDAAATTASTAVQGAASGEKVLSKTGTTLKTTLDLAYDSANKKIQLLGISDAVVAELDATAFIKDGMVSNVSFDGSTKELTITFNTDAGKENIVVDMTSLVDTYTAGNGISIASNVVSIKIDTASESFLSVSSSGLKLSGVQDAIDSAKTSAISSAAADATTKANAAQTAAASDATTKANAARDAAIDAAAQDASEKAQTAIETAAADAKTKADNALTSAKSYTDTQITAAKLVWETI